MLISLSGHQERRVCKALENVVDQTLTNLAANKNLMAVKKTYDLNLNREIEIPFGKDCLSGGSYLRHHEMNGPFRFCSHINTNVFHVRACEVSGNSDKPFEFEAYS